MPMNAHKPDDCGQLYRIKARHDVTKGLENTGAYKTAEYPDENHVVVSSQNSQVVAGLLRVS